MLLVVGLIMGTRMWYAMWDAEKDDDAAFERRVDGVVREIGERGKVSVPESVPPLSESTSARLPLPTPAPAPQAPALAPAAGATACTATCLRGSVFSPRRLGCSSDAAGATACTATC